VTLPTITEPTKKSFWSRPEGKVGLIINAAIAAALFYGWGVIVPFVLAALTSTLHLVVVATALFSLLWVLFDGNFRRFAWYLYKSGIRKLTSWFVDLDPIGILKSYIEKLKGKKEELEASVGEIKGQRIELTRSLKKNQEAYESTMSNLEAAKAGLASGDAAKQRQAGRIQGVQSKQATRLSAMVETQKAHLKKFDFIVEVLTRYGEVCDDTMLDMDNEVKYREEERKQARAFKKGMSAAFGILKGLPDDQEMYDMALESLENEYTQKMGEVENALDLTKNVILQADFNDAAALAKADALLNKWKGTNTDVQLSKGGETKQTLIAAAEQHVPFKLNVPVQEKVSILADKMFD